jgi:hypothetical protein
LLTWQSAKKALMTPFYRRLCRGQRDSRRCSFQLRPTEQVDPSGFCAPTERENAELWERGCSGCGAAIPNSCTCLKRVRGMQARAIDKEAEVTYCLAG